MAGIKNIYGMTKPLGYYRGGRAGAPELDEGYDPVLKGYGEAVANINNPEYINKWNMTKPRQPGLDEKLMQDYEPPIPRWGKAKNLGKKGLDALKRLVEETIGAGPAEGSESYLDKSKIVDMKTDDLLGELKSMGASHEDPVFPTIANRPGNKWKTYNTMKLILDELMSRLDLD